MFLKLFEIYPVEPNRRLTFDPFSAILGSIGVTGHSSGQLGPRLILCGVLSYGMARADLAAIVAGLFFAIWRMGVERKIGRL